MADTTPAGGGVPVATRGAVKRFGPKTALDGVDLSVAAGSVFVLLGPSGSGKTTLLRSVAGIERLTAGRIDIGERTVADGPLHLPPERRDLAMVFQDYALWPHLSAVHNVAFALGRRRLGRAEAVRRARGMLERVGLGHLAERYPNELSGGEQQRVALARALVGETGLLLFDEPLSNLDADLRERMRLEISTLVRDSGATALYITHDQSEAFALADTMGVLDQGRLVQVGPPEAVYHRPASPFVARFTGLAGEIPVHLEATVPGDEPSVAVRPSSGGRDCPPIVAPAPTAVPTGGEGVLLVRPAAVRLLPGDDPVRQLRGMVLDAAYRGRGYDHAVLLECGSQLVGVHDTRRWARGDAVGVALAPTGTILFDAAACGAPTLGTAAACPRRPVPAAGPVLAAARSTR